MGLRASRRLVSKNPLRLVELPPNDEKPRLRVALAPEAAALLAALEPGTVSPTPSRSTRDCAAQRSTASNRRTCWTATRVLVRRSKSEAGTQRRPPIADNLRTILLHAWQRQGKPLEGRVIDRSVMSGKIARRVEARWEAAGLSRITLHECRHTYASLLMAAGYTIKELMEFMGHADLQMVNRYVKLLPQPGEDDAADRLNAYLRRATQAESRQH